MDTAEQLKQLNKMEVSSPSYQKDFDPTPWHHIKEGVECFACAKITYLAYDNGMELRGFCYKCACKEYKLELNG